MQNAIFLQIAKTDVKKIIVIKAIAFGTKLVCILNGEKD